MLYKDALKIFNITGNETNEEIKKVYRKLMLKYHPDVTKESNATEMVYKIDEAYKILTNTTKQTNKHIDYIFTRYTHKSILNIEKL